MKSYLPKQAFFEGRLPRTLCALFVHLRRRHVSTSCGAARPQGMYGVGVLEGFIKAH